MAPPPVTPSPHRFIASKPTNPNLRPSSSLRFQQQQPQSSSSSQFASTPRFNFSASQKPGREVTTPATQYSSPLSRRPHRPNPPLNEGKEEIEEATGSEHEDERSQGEDECRFVLPTQPTSKRRRPNPPQEAINISSSPSPSPPSTPPLPSIEREDRISRFIAHHETPSTHPAPRFVLPSPAPSARGNSTIPSRPPVILPPRSPSPSSDPPLAFFSPHRRGQKYIPGGLASMTRDWIVETAQAAYGHKGKGPETWDVRLRVGDCRSGDVGVGMVLVRELETGDGWMLVGSGRIGIGCTVGVKEPMWDVEVLGEKWRVGVEWKVLEE